MHLEKLSIQNFRSFETIDIPLSKDLTLFVGENNGGKSNAIDAIRLITTPLGGRRELYCEPSDIRFGSTTKRFDIEAVYSELSPAQQGRFISAATDETLEKASFGFIYDESKGGAVIRPSIWAGQFKGAPEPGCHDMLRHVYLPPLRDAKRALASGNPTRILALLNHFLAEDPVELAKRLKRNPNEPILDQVGTAVGTGLSALTSGVRRQAASLGFSTDENLIDIARDLRFKLADHGIEPEDLRFSGHGFANLLYMATIAVELEKAKTADLTLFLVEEPEAHLHPQLQAAVLCFLEEQAEKSRAQIDGDGPAGQVQVIVATHSPNLTAWVASKRLVVFKSRLVEAGDTAGEPDLTAAGADTQQAAENTNPRVDGDAAAEAAPDPVPALTRKVSRCIPLSSLSIADEDRRKIDRYLDVTKSAFLFGGRVLLVEGMAEALLLPIIAEKFTLKDLPEKRRLFRSVVFVPIDGVDFHPYVTFLLTAHHGSRIADRVVIMTDGDRTNEAIGTLTDGEARKSKLDALVATLDAATDFEATLNTYSLETELIRAGNKDLLKEVYLQLHPQSGKKWDDAMVLTGDAQAEAIRKIFETTAKGDFAQRLAEKIHGGAAFHVPAYIKATIESVVK